MEHTVDLFGITSVALAALVFGMAAARFKQPAIVGYILAGVILGPTAFRVVANQEQVSALAELGVLLLLFLVGMELSVRAFLVTWRLAATAVALQVGISVVVMLLASWLFGFSSSMALLLGFFVALSSTAVAIKMLEEIGQLRTRVGRVTVSILIAQDLAFLPMLLVVDFIGVGGIGFWGILKFLFSVGLLALLMAVLNQRRRVNLPLHNIFANHADLSPLTGLAYCFGVAAFFGLVGLSEAYGAFLAGLVIGNSAQRKQMHAAVQPVQSILVMVFFLSIGLLIDMGYIWAHLGTVLGLLLMVTLFKTAMNVGILRSLGESWQRAFLDGVIISQIGEFSFLLAATALAVGAIDADGARLVVSVTVLSLVLSPIWMTSARRVQRMAERSGMTLRDLLRLTYMRERIAIHRARAVVERKLRGAGLGARKPIGALPAPAAATPPAASNAADAAHQSTPSEPPPAPDRPEPVSAADMPPSEPETTEPPIAAQAADEEPRNVSAAGSGAAESAETPEAATAPESEPSPKAEPSEDEAQEKQGQDMASLGRLVRAVAERHARMSERQESEKGDGDTGNASRDRDAPQSNTRDGSGA